MVMGLFACPLCCGQFFEDLDDLKHHIASKLKDIKCPFCFELISDINQYADHVDNCSIKKETEDDEEEEETMELVTHQTEVIHVHPDEVNVEESGDPIEVEHNEDIHEEEDVVKQEIQANEEITTTEDETITTQIEDIQEETGSEQIDVEVDIRADLVLSNRLLKDNLDSEEQGSTAEDGENVYHCSSCNVQFSNVDDHLAMYHSDQQVYLQLPGEEGKTVTINKDPDEPMVTLPGPVTDDNDQAIWVKWDNVFYLSTRSPEYKKFKPTYNLGYVLREKVKYCSASDLSPFYLEDEYGDKFFSVPVDTAIDYFESSHGRVGPKTFAGQFSREILTKNPNKKHQHYERIISTSQLSLTQILFSKMPPDQFVPVIEQICPSVVGDEGTKFKLYWKCNTCQKELDTWERHDCNEEENEDESLDDVNKENDELEENRPQVKHFCKKCKIVFHNDAFFFQHVRLKHSRNMTPVELPNKSNQPKIKEKLVVGKFYCQPCKLMFASHKWLMQHHKNEHSQPSQITEDLITIDPKDPANRTCTDCANVEFVTLELYFEHRRTFHNDSAVPENINSKIKKTEFKYTKPKFNSLSAGVRVDYESTEVEEDEIVPDDWTALEPKILRTCGYCIKVKNSIENLRKHLKLVHNDENIKLDWESQPDSQKLDVPSDADASIITDEEVSKHMEQSQPPKPILYKFKNDGLFIEDVLNRYKEYQIICLGDFFSTPQCLICNEMWLDTLAKQSRHVEAKHSHEICIESFFLAKKKLTGKPGRKRKKIDISEDSTFLSDDWRNSESINSDSIADSQNLELYVNSAKSKQSNVITVTLNPENDSIVEVTHSESNDENESTAANDAPPIKKLKYEIIKADAEDLPESVRKTLDDQCKKENIQEVYMDDLFIPEDRTSKLTIEVMDFLNYKDKLVSRDTSKIKYYTPSTPRNTPRNESRNTPRNESRNTPRNEFIKKERNTSVKDFNGNLATSCMTCKVTFSTERWLERHKEVFHKNCSECSVCSLLIQDHVMEIHMKGHNTPLDNNCIEYVCKECNNSFESEEHLNYHKLVHQNKVMVIQKQRCPDCSEEFMDADLLKNHMKLHSSRRTYKCNYCHRLFYILAEKVVHERIHTGVKPFACDICGKAFRKKFSLTMHNRHVHINERRYNCGICEAKFVTNSSLIVHIQRHDSTPRFKCKLCPKLFTNTGTRANHVRRKHYGTVEYVCKHCTRVFYGMSALRKHYAKHDSNDLKFPCYHCKQVYGRALFLNKHLKEAHGDFVVS